MSPSWRSTFIVADASSHERGDKIILPQSALVGLLDACRDVPSKGPLRWDTDQPRDEQSLPHPLTFRLSSAASGTAVYAGVREFSGGEGVATLPPFIVEALGIKRDETDDARVAVNVSLELLPKGRYVRLRPLEAGYNPDDWRPLLEREFRRNFTTLTPGTVVSVLSPRNDEYRFLVDKVSARSSRQHSDDNDEGNAPAICVVDTDLEVDIEPLDEAQAVETLASITKQLADSEGGEIDVWRTVGGVVEPGKYVDYTLPSWNKTSTLVIELSGLERDSPVDLFASPRSARYRTLPRDDDHVFGVFDSSSSAGEKSITIAPSNTALEGAESLCISVHGYYTKTSGNAPPISYNLRVSHSTASAATAPPKTTHDGEVRCPNCNAWVPEHTFPLHEGFCRRNNICCPQCSRVFKRNLEEAAAHWHCPRDDGSGDSPESRSRHDDIHHTSRTCSCGFVCASLPSLAAHRTSNCPNKLILCQFCHLQVAQEGDPANPHSQATFKGMTEHEYAEGSRTAECHLCDRSVRLFDMDAHLRLHAQDKSHRAAPTVCLNANCGRIVNGPATRQKLSPGDTSLTRLSPPMLCSTCAVPLHSTMHDPDNKALRRRIERRYLQQLMVGCAKPWCRNEFCRAGRSTLGLPETGKGTKDVFPLVKPLMEMSPGEGGAMWFCVDQASAAQRAMADMLASEGVWDFPWCVAACEVVGPDAAAARSWLGDWAPSKVGTA